MPRPLHGWGAEAPRRALGRPAEKRQSQDWNPRRTDDFNRSCRGGGFRGKRTEDSPGLATRRPRRSSRTGQTSTAGA